GVVFTWGDRSGSAQKPIEVGSKDAIARLGIASLIGRASFSLPRLVLTAADVRLNPPAPAAGQPVQLSVHAQNMGSADAKGVRVEIFADQVKIGEAGGDIVAGKDYVFTGFPGWTPAAGSHVLLCRATVSGQTVEATREITTALGVMLVKPFLQQPILVANPELKSDPGAIATASATNDSQPGNNEARASTSILRSIQKEGPGQLVVPQDPAQPRLIRP